MREGVLSEKGAKITLHAAHVFPGGQIRSINCEMEESMPYPHLFEKGYIGNVQIKNRIVMAAMGIPGLTEHTGTFSDRAIDYYERRAIGETGLIITGVCLVDSKIEPWEVEGVSHLVTMDAHWKVRNFIQLTERVHDCGAKIFAQLTAGFGRVFPPNVIDGAKSDLIAPSTMPLFWRPDRIAREMRPQEIDELVRAFGKAASIARISQFDGIELHGHEGYLMDQFTTALWNKRTDKYGGDLMGRMTFVLSIIKTIQEKAGPDFPIVYRYGLEHKIEGGRTGEEGIEMAKALEAAGVAALHVDAGCYENSYWPHPPIYQPPACMVDLAEMVKPHVKIPIITVGRLGYPELADQILGQGKADFIALGRPLLADPDFALKAKRGQEKDVRPCIGCHECFVRLLKQQSLSCAVNPQCGDEKRLQIVPAAKQKKVMIVGGGIGGMEAARVCALRGHRVTLYEKTGRLGGLLNVASEADFKHDIRRLLDYQINQLSKLKVIEARLNTEVTEELMKGEKPDTIFIATGSKPLSPVEIEGLEKASFVTPEEVYEEKIPAGSKVLVIGGGSVGCETAVYLAQKKWSVVVAEMLSAAASDLFGANQEMLLRMMKELGVEVWTQSKVTKVEPGKVFLNTAAGEKEFVADLIVLAVGRQPVNYLAALAEGLADEVYVIGDSRSPGKIQDAMWDAFKRARIV
jgi:2-enoate reductase